MDNIKITMGQACQLCGEGTASMQEWICAACRAKWQKLERFLEQDVQRALFGICENCGGIAGKHDCPGGAVLTFEGDESGLVYCGICEKVVVADGHSHLAPDFSQTSGKQIKGMIQAWDTDS